LPFIISMAVCVNSCNYIGTHLHVGYTKTWQLIGTSRVGYVDDGMAACEFGGRLSEDGIEFLEDKSPFHCVCHNRDHPWDEPHTVEQWGRVVDKKRVAEEYDMYTGSTGDLFDQKNTPFKNGRDEVMDICKDKKGVDRWCWKKKDMSQSEKPVVHRDFHCSTFGTRRGQTMSYVAIHFGEILTLLTYRRDGFSLTWIFSNTCYLVLATLNILALFTFVYFVPLAQLLKLEPLPAWELSIALSFAVLLLCITETCKVIYRVVLGHDIEAQQEKAALCSRGKSTPWEEKEKNQ